LSTFNEITFNLFTLIKMWKLDFIQLNFQELEINKFLVLRIDILIKFDDILQECSF